MSRVLHLCFLSSDSCSCSYDTKINLNLHSSLFVSLRQHQGATDTAIHEEPAQQTSPTLKAGVCSPFCFDSRKSERLPFHQVSLHLNPPFESLQEERIVGHQSMKRKIFKLNQKCVQVDKFNIVDIVGLMIVSFSEYPSSPLCRRHGWRPAITSSVDLQEYHSTGIQVWVSDLSVREATIDGPSSMLVPSFGGCCRQHFADFLTLGMTLVKPTNKVIAMRTAYAPLQPTAFMLRYGLTLTMRL